MADVALGRLQPRLDPIEPVLDPVDPAVRRMFLSIEPTPGVWSATPDMTHPDVLPS